MSGPSGGLSDIGCCGKRRAAQQPVEAVRVLLRDDDRAHAGLPLHQALGAQQVERLAHGVAGGAVVLAERVLQGEYASGEAAGEDLVAEQIGELPCPVGAQPAAARGGDRRGVLAGAFGWHRPAPGLAGRRVVRGPCRRGRAGGVAEVLRHLATAFVPPLPAVSSSRRQDLPLRAAAPGALVRQGPGAPDGAGAWFSRSGGRSGCRWADRSGCRRGATSAGPREGRWARSP